jgi:hypothetical protein
MPVTNSSAVARLTVPSSPPVMRTDLDAGCTQSLANLLRSLRVLRGIADENGLRSAAQ